MDCTSLNLLCGLNGMGKSSVIQALLVLRQSFEAGELGLGRLVLGGDLVDIGTSSDVLFEDAERDVLEFTLEGDETEDPWELKFDCSRTSDLLRELSDGTARIPVAEQDKPPLAEFLALHPDAGNILRSVLGPAKFQAMSEGQRRPYPLPELGEWQKVPPFGGRLVYVNAERVGPRKFYPLSEMLARRVDFGTSGEYALNYLNANQNKLMPVDDTRLVGSGGRRMLDVVNRWLQEVCPGAHLQVEEVRDVDAVIAGFTFERMGDVRSRRHRATNVGFGLSYVLPVILALLSPPGTLCLIENPEAHLHPRGQTMLAELAVRASKAGVQVFAETHSDHFMDGVRIAVRDGLIKPTDATFHYFEREGSRTVVTSPQIDLDGRLSSWPVGFFDQHEENLAKLLAPRH